MNPRSIVAPHVGWKLTYQYTRRLGYFSTRNPNQSLIHQSHAYTQPFKCPAWVLKRYLRFIKSIILQKVNIAMYCQQHEYRRLVWHWQAITANFTLQNGSVQNSRKFFSIQNRRPLHRSSIASILFVSVVQPTTACTNRTTQPRCWNLPYVPISISKYSAWALFQKLPLLGRRAHQVVKLDWRWSALPEEE